MKIKASAIQFAIADLQDFLTENRLSLRNLKLYITTVNGYCQLNAQTKQYAVGEGNVEEPVNRLLETIQYMVEKTYGNYAAVFDGVLSRMMIELSFDEQGIVFESTKISCRYDISSPQTSDTKTMVGGLIKRQVLAEQSGEFDGQATDITFNFQKGQLRSMDLHTSQVENEQFSYGLSVCDRNILFFEKLVGMFENTRNRHQPTCQLTYSMLDRNNVHMISGQVRPSGTLKIDRVSGAFDFKQIRGMFIQLNQVLWVNTEARIEGVRLIQKVTASQEQYYVTEWQLKSKANAHREQVSTEASGTKAVALMFQDMVCKWATVPAMGIPVWLNTFEIKCELKADSWNTQLEHAVVHHSFESDHLGSFALVNHLLTAVQGIAEIRIEQIGSKVRSVMVDIDVNRVNQTDEEQTSIVFTDLKSSTSREDHVIKTIQRTDHTFRKTKLDFITRRSAR